MEISTILIGDYLEYYPAFTLRSFCTFCGTAIKNYITFPGQTCSKLIVTGIEVSLNRMKSRIGKSRDKNDFEEFP
jgi:hypothetical protein